MSVEDYSVLNNLLFIVILIFVCGMASLFSMWINKRMLFNYWIFSTIYFVAITFVTIFGWHFVIGFTF